MCGQLESTFDLSTGLKLIARHSYGESHNEATVYLWARDRGELVVRFFFSQLGAVVEDPATGSGCANLGGWMIASGQPLPMVARFRTAITSGGRHGSVYASTRTELST